MLTITLCNCSCDNRVVDKSNFIVNNNNKQCDVYNECSIMNPVFLLKYEASLVQYNYVYIPSWNRYYFITDMTVAPGGRLYITCNEDVLMSNKDAILELTAQITRNEDVNRRNKFIVDNRNPVEVKPKISTKQFNASPFNVDNGYNIVLTVVGGEQMTLHPD